MQNTVVMHCVKQLRDGDGLRAGCGAPQRPGRMKCHSQRRLGQRVAEGASMEAASHYTAHAERTSRRVQGSARGSVCPAIGCQLRQRRQQGVDCVSRRHARAAVGRAAGGGAAARRLRRAAGRRELGQHLFKVVAGERPQVLAAAGEGTVSRAWGGRGASRQPRCGGVHTGGSGYASDA